MTDARYHPEGERLESFAAGELERGDAAVVESHLLECARCRAEVEEWRSLFATLAELPALQPAAGFEQRVMARVRIRQPFAARLAALLERLAPRSPQAWALLIGILALPTLGVAGLIAWVATLPWLTIEGLAAFAAREIGEALVTLPQRGFGLLADSTVGVWVNEALQRVLAADTGQIGLAAATFAVLLVLSVWVLYDNFFRPPSRDHGYANYCY